MRKLIAAFKSSVDLRIEGAEGFADWVQGWSDDYGLMPRIDACLLGGAMYRGYEPYWTAIQTHTPGEPLPMTGRLPTAAEIEWADFAARTPHYVVSGSLDAVEWPQTRHLRSLEEVAALKQTQGKDIYLMGGAMLASSLMDAGLIDELRLLVYPLIAGTGKSLFARNVDRIKLDLVEAKPMDEGIVSLVYRRS